MDEKEELVETKANNIKIKLEETVLRSDLEHEAEFALESWNDQNVIHIKTEIKEEHLWEEESEEIKYQPEESFESASIWQTTKEECVSENSDIDKDLLSSESTRLNAEAGYDDDNYSCVSLLEKGHSPQGEVTLDCKPSNDCTADAKNGNEEFSTQDFCSVQYNLPLEYKNVKSASELVQRLYRCDFCEKSFKKRYDLNRHFVVHSGVKPFKCDSCEKSFNKKASLMRHAVIHAGTKPYKCDTCDKSFNSNSNLKAHIVCHSGIKPYKCGICEKSYNNKSNLLRHVLCHSGARPFKCSSCEKSFTRKSTLMRHALCHTDTKPYECDQCDKGFKRKSHLIRHILMHSV